MRLVTYFGCMGMCLLAGCATTGGKPADLLRHSANPAWAMGTTDDDLIVAVSPARQTLQILGSSAMVLGAGISAVVDDQYRRRIEEALGDYDPKTVFENRLTERLEESLEKTIQKVEPQGTSAGYQNAREAAMARYAGLAKAGNDLVLDLHLTFGIFGFEGTLITKIEGKLTETATGHALWRGNYFVSPEPMLADDKYADPTSRITPNLSSPRLAVDEKAVDKWLTSDGTLLRERFEYSVNAVVSALLTDMGLADESLGAYYLGKHAMAGKDYKAAQAWFQRARALDAGNLDAQNGETVAFARAGKLDEALAQATALAEAAPEYAPAAYNLAYWLAVEKKDAAAAQPWYDKAKALGMDTPRKLDSAMAKKR